MKKAILGVLTMGIIAMLTGCGKEAVTVDYADYPENFMIKLEANQNYILKDGDSCTDFSLKTRALFKSHKKMIYGDLSREISRDIYYRKDEPVLVHYHDNDYLWICEISESGTILSASYLYVNDYHSFGGDNGQLNLTIADSVLDPADFVMEKYINCFGDVTVKVHYHLNEEGKPEETPTNDKFYMLEAPYTEEVLCLDEDINTWVYADKDATESTVEVLPAGTSFRRFRVPINEEYSYVEGILDDGRIMRVIEEYWFSEPSAYQAMIDKDAKQFSYSSK